MEGLRLAAARRWIAVAGAAVAVAGALAACGSHHRTTTARFIAPGTGIPPSLAREARPIGQGPRFHPPATGPVAGRCSPRLGKRDGVHVELFAADRVLLVAAGIGTRPPLAFSEGRISDARCYGDLVTLEPTGVVLIRRGLKIRLATLFAAWGQPLSRRRLASFAAGPGTEVAVFVNGLRWTGEPGAVVLSRHDEIVLEVGPYVPPHPTYTFPPGT
ncbi:MAG TPA: hypothetical protein VGL51_04555 [Solirubrobacteraceae bacterium]